jgi:hypothetical protein
MRHHQDWQKTCCKIVTAKTNRNRLGSRASNMSSMIPSREGEVEIVLA